MVTPSVMFGHTEKPDHSVGGAIYLASSYLKRSSTHPQRTGASYGRSTSPNHDHLIESLKMLYGCDYCIPATSGTSALSSILQVLRPSTLLLDTELYCGTPKLVRYYQETEHDIKYEMRDLTAEEDTPLDASNCPGVIIFESCSNPSGRFIDIAKVRSRFPSSTIIVDNTTLSGALFNPFEVDGNIIVFESLTKYVGGGEVVMGCVLTNIAFIAKKFDRYMRTHGHHISAFDAHLVTQSLTTLSLRIDNISDKALKIAQFLQTIPCIKQVFYPLLPNHPTFHIANKYVTKGAGMINFHLPMRRNEAEKLMDSGKKIMYATSYGKPQTLFDPYPKETEDGTWVRLSIGHLWTFEELRDELIQMFIPYLTTRQWYTSSNDWNIMVTNDLRIVLNSPDVKVEEDVFALHKWKQPA